MLRLVVTVETASDQESGSQAVRAPLRSVRTGSVAQQSRKGISGHQRSPRVQRTAGRWPSGLSSWGKQTGDSDCGPEGRRFESRGSATPFSSVRPCCRPAHGQFDCPFPVL
jgi:hypothetical protein